MATTLTIAFLVSLAAAQGAGAASSGEAERLARHGQTREALEQFQQIVARQPQDLEARLWIARLLRRQGKPDLAAQEFRRVLMRAPEHVEALTGLAAALNVQRQYWEASELLDRAESLAPRNAEVLAARAQGLRLSGRSAAAEEYYARAQALSPDDPDIQQGLDRTRRLNRHRIEAILQHETLTRSSAAAHAGDIALDVRATDRVRFNARVQAYRRFSHDEARAGGGFEWRARPDVTIRGTALAGPGAEVIARVDTMGEVEHVRGRLESAFAVRFVSFATARVWIFAPSATCWLDDRTAVILRYYGSSTTFSGRSADANHSGAIKVRYSVRPRIGLDLGYSRGYESFERLSTDRLSLFRADTFSGGMVYHLPGLQSVAANVDLQRSSDDRKMVRVTVAVVHRF